MAAIWRALDEQTGEQVAIKLLHPHLAASEDARVRLDREAAALGAIDHPNVVAVREVIFDADGPAVVMDYVEGASLAERLADGPALTERESLGIALEVTEALRAVHATGLVHRDVKPGNILLGSDGRTRLIDFGIATDIEAESEASALTAVDDVIGTLRYLAPERLTGAAATPRTDLWGVGAVLYEMLATEPAYPSATIVERVAQPASMPERPSGIGDAAWAVVAGAMAADPDDRPADATELAADLRAALPELPEPIAPPSDPWADTMAIPLAGGSVARGGATGADAATGGAAPRPAAGMPAAAAGLAGPSWPATAPGGPQPMVAAVSHPRDAGSAGSRRRTAVLGVAALALVVVVAGAMSGGNAAADGPATTAPASVPTASVTPRPTVTAEPQPDEPASDSGQGKGKGKGKDRGKGKGGDD